MGCKMGQEAMMRPIRLPPQTGAQLEALDELYRTTKDVRLRQRAQLVLLAAEKGLVAAEIGAIVRLSEESVRRWLKRYVAEGVEGLSDEPRLGTPKVVTEGYVSRLVELVRRRPRSPTYPFRCGRVNVWRITWQKKQACASAMKRSDVI
jgi:transposase